MNKADIIGAVAQREDVSKKDADRIVSAFIDVISEALVAGERVQLVGFGSFEVRERAARVGRNPQSKQAMQIPASRTPAFHAGKTLKDAVNAGK